MTRRLICLCALLVFAAQHANAAIIASWNFNDQDLVVDQGAGTMTVDLLLNPGLAEVFTAGTAIGAENGVAAGQAFALEVVSADVTSYDIRFAVDTTGFEDVQVSWTWRADPSWRVDIGAQSTWGWSANGGANFTQLSQIVPPEDFLSRTSVFHGTADDNNPNVVFQFRQTVRDKTIGEQFVLDNITFEAADTSAVPEPSSFFSLFFAAAMGATVVRRSRRIKTIQNECIR